MFWLNLNLVCTHKNFMQTSEINKVKGENYILFFLMIFI